MIILVHTPYSIFISPMLCKYQFSDNIVMLNSGGNFVIEFLIMLFGLVKGNFSFSKFSVKPIILNRVCKVREHYCYQNV